MIAVQHDSDSNNERYDEARFDFRFHIGHYGSNYLTSLKGLDLKGRGIKLFSINSKGQKVYKLTDRAFDLVEKRYRILSESHD